MSCSCGNCKCCATQQQVCQLLSSVNVLLQQYNTLQTQMNNVLSQISSLPSSLLVESGVSKKISALTSASSLTGSELAVVVQGGVDSQTTTQDIANLAPPSLLVESGVATKISALPAASALDGTELVPLVQSAADVQTTTQAIANLAPVTRAAFYQQLSIYGSFGPDTIFSPGGGTALLALIYTDIRNAATGNITLQLNWLDGQSNACFSEPIVIETSVFPGYTSIGLALPIVTTGDLQITATDGTGGACQYDVTVVLLNVPFS